MQRSAGDREVTSVFIIAASDVVRAGLESLVAGDAGFTVMGSAVDLSDFPAQGTEGASPDVVIFDATRYGEETFESLRTFIEEIHDPASPAGQLHWGGGGENVPALVIIGAEPGEWLTEALRAGVVRATLPRAASSGEIIAAVRAASTGLIVLDPETFAAVLSTPTSTVDDLPNAQPYDERFPSVEPVVDALTPREREVLEMLAEGLSNKEIAGRLKISEHTVKFHVASIFAKLDASTRTEAVMHGIRQGLIMM